MIGEMMEKNGRGNACLGRVIGGETYRSNPYSTEHSMLYIPYGIIRCSARVVGPLPCLASPISTSPIVL